MGGEELTLLGATSADHGWTYHAFVPTGVLLQQVDRMRSISLLVVVLVLALMAVIVGAMSSAFSKPIREIASMVAKSDSDHPPTDEISQIRGGLSSLIDRNAGLQRDLEQHTRLLRSSFLSQLLLNGFRSAAALKRYLETAGLALGSGGFRVLVATVSTADPGERRPGSAAQQGARVLATRTIASAFGELVQTQTIDSDRIAMLLARQRPLDRAALTQQLTGVARLLLTQYGIRLYNTQLRLRIADYLAEHADDPMLNLYAVAKSFDLNEKYLSRYFHDQTGQTFSSYLERLRMDRAVAMLRTTDATVDVVAESVGYASTNTFHKAFRRTYSTTPGRFRRDIRHNGAAEAM